MDDRWLSPQAIIKIGFEQCRVVMMNEAHHYMQRCIRTREVGKRILQIAHQSGVRYLAMEALTPADLIINQTRRITSSDNEFFNQAEMRDFVQTALNLGWTLIAYDVDTRDYLHSKRLQLDYKAYTTEEWNDIVCTNEFWQWRESSSAQTLTEQFMQLAEDQKMLVWVGWQHHSPKPIMMFDNEKQHTMGYYFQQITKTKYFSIDQTTTIFDDPYFEDWRLYAQNHIDSLNTFGGTAGFIRDNLPSELQTVSNLHLHDAYLLSTQNQMV
ncbi:MAG: hypothetical protein WBC91_24720 [Phototrophicaceae bacterium]